MCLATRKLLVAHAIGCPKTLFCCCFFCFLFFSFFLFSPSRTRDLLVSQKQQHKDTFLPPSIPLPRYFLQLQQWWHLYCFAILGSTSTVIHSVKQSLLRNRPGSDAATSRDFLREILQRAFPRANQLH